jgi:hypothetical protein
MSDLGALRSLVRDINFDVHGIPATVTRPYPHDTPIETRIIWALPSTDAVPFGSEFQRQESKRVMAFRLDEVPTVPTKTIVVAPEAAGGVDQRWRVEGPERLESDHGRYIVVLDPLPY